MVRTVATKGSKESASKVAVEVLNKENTVVQLTPWQYLVETVFTSDWREDHLLVSGLFEQVTFLLKQFATLVSKTCTTKDGGGAPLVLHPIIRNVLGQASDAKLYIDSQVDLVNFMQGEMFPSEDLQQAKERDAATKPSMTYAQLIQEALDHSKKGKLTVAQILRSISKRHIYFNDLHPKENSWKRSVRQNLALNSQFVNEPDGIMAYWALAPAENSEESVKSETRDIDAKKSAVMSSIQWQPHFLVDQDTYAQMKKGAAPLKCPRCGFEPKRLRRLVLHWHDGGAGCDKWLASCCAKEVTGKKYLDPGRRYACTHPDCQDSSRLWAYRQPVQIHYNQEHQASFKGRLVRCDQCSMTFIAAWMLKQHMRLDHAEGGEAAYPCSSCGRIMKTKQSLNNHEKYNCTASEVARTANKVECDICGQSVSRNSLLDHKRNWHAQKIGHVPQKNFACETCGKAFVSKSKLVEHRSTHNDKPDPKFQCPVSGCNKFLKQSNSFRKHMMNTHKQGHACDICEKLFFTADYLDQHKRDKHKM